MDSLISFTHHHSALSTASPILITNGPAQLPAASVCAEHSTKGCSTELWVNSRQEVAHAARPQLLTATTSGSPLADAPAITITPPNVLTGGRAVKQPGLAWLPAACWGCRGGQTNKLLSKQQTGSSSRLNNYEQQQGGGLHSVRGGK